MTDSQEPATCQACGVELDPENGGNLCAGCLLMEGLDLVATQSATPAPHDDDIDQIAGVFPDFALRGKLGGGAMGTVYRAEQLKLGREVAIKVIADDIAADPQFLLRFEREAQTLAKLNHPNIVTIHDFGKDLDICYFVMEYLEGQDLAALLEQRRLPQEEALCIFRQVCQALAYAHDLGVTHRDVKPANIFVSPDNRVKLVDFGLVKWQHLERGAEDLTTPNAAMGTPRYMAPEQWTESHAVDSRADIFSLGILLYELLTGEPPVGFLTPLSVKIGVDPAWDRLVSQCVETAPDARYQSVADLLADLEALEHDPSGETTLPADDPLPHVVLSFAEDDALSLVAMGRAIREQYRLLEDPLEPDRVLASQEVPVAFAQAKVLLLVVSQHGQGALRQFKRRLAVADRQQMPVIVLHMDEAPLEPMQFLLGTAHAWLDAESGIDEAVVAEVMRRLGKVLAEGGLDSQMNALSDSTLPEEVGTASSGKVIAFLSRRAGALDEQLVQALKESLHRHGIEFYQDRHETIGMEWFQEVQDKMERLDAVIPLLSESSINSEMLALEISKAHEVNQANPNTLKILPVRVDYTGPLPTELARCLDHRPYFLWQGGADTAALVQSLLKGLHAAPTKDEARARMPTGAVPLDSPFYIERANDGPFHEAVARSESIILVKAGRQMGKTSLLARGLNRARQNGDAVVLTDLNAFDESSMQSLESFYKALGAVLADELELDDYPEDIWRDQRGPNDNFGNYVRRKVLKPLDGRLIWALDEADRLFAYDYASEAFGLFRSWHNARALDPEKPWSKLTLVISYATEASLFIRDPNMSPFNVGQLLQMRDFTRSEVQELNDRYGLPLQSGEEIDALMRLVGGHPFLIRRCLHAIAVEGVSLAQILAHGADDEGMFADHLRRLTYLLLNYDEGDRALARSLSNLLDGSPDMPPEHFFRLRSAGILTGDRTLPTFRCAIYEDYLKRYLL